MTRIGFFGAAAVLSVMISAPASAQHMIDEPGMFAFAYPNGDLGIGSPLPAGNAQAMAMAPRTVMRHPVRHAKSDK